MPLMVCRAAVMFGFHEKVAGRLSEPFFWASKPTDTVTSGVKVGGARCCAVNPSCEDLPLAPCILPPSYPFIPSLSLPFLLLLLLFVSFFCLTLFLSTPLPVPPLPLIPSLSFSFVVLTLLLSLFPPFSLSLGPTPAVSVPLSLLVSPGEPGPAVERFPGEG